MNKHFENQIILAAKGKYQVFTPEDIVEEMLDLAGYRENILENAFSRIPSGTVNSFYKSCKGISMKRGLKDAP